MLSHLVNYFLDTFDRSKSHGETLARFVLRFVPVHLACWESSEASDIDTIHEFVSHDSAADRPFCFWCLLLSSLCSSSGFELVVHRYHCRSCSTNRCYRVPKIQQYHRPHGYSHYNQFIRRRNHWKLQCRRWWTFYHPWNPHGLECSASSWSEI
jgi:hypothetical protein